MLDSILPAQEYDLKLMTLVIFLPSIVAGILLVIPQRFAEALRWITLLGAALTFTASVCMVIDYYHMLDSYSERGVRSLHHPKTTLEARMDRVTARASRDVPEARLNDDWVSRVPWIERFDIHYTIGIDGISLPLVVLTTLVMLLAVVASWTIDKHLKAYLALLMLLETGVIGAFMSLDLFLFYVFYELMLLPMYFLIGLWGGGRRKYAAVKFVIYTLFGSILILIAMLCLYYTDVRDFVDHSAVKARTEERIIQNPRLTAEEARTYNTFDLITLQRAGQAAMVVLNGQEERLTNRDNPLANPVLPGDASDAETAKDKKEALLPLLGRGVNVKDARQRLRQPFFTQTYQYVLFLLLFIGFAVKVPIVPLHNWLPDAHVEAPTPVSMILAGVLLKLGGYGIIRMAYPLCPWAAHQLAFVVGFFGAFAIIYGALVAMGQSDFKKLLAYSSVSHMGYVVLGIACWSSMNQSQYWSWGVNGAMFQMVSHGITSAALFFVVGVIYERAHHRDLNRFGGLMEPMPLYGGMSAILFFASMGLPGLCGFVGEVFVVLAAWHFNPWLALIAIVTTVLTAGYLLWAWQRVYLGTNPATANYPDLSLREGLCLLPFVIFAIALGVLPQTILMVWMEPSVTSWVDNLARLGK